MTEKEDLQQLLQKLVQAIYSTINEGLAKKSLQPQYEPYFRWKLSEFEYGDAGIIKKSAKGEEFLKPYWGRAARDITQKVSEQSVYDDTLTAISKSYGIGETQCGRYLEALTTKVATGILTGKIKTPADSDKCVDSFLKDLNGEQQECRAEVHLKGLILQPKFIKLDENVRLRKPERNDFEKEVPRYYLLLGDRVTEDPTAFLHTRVCAKGETSAITLQNEVDNTVTILRLFRVGAVHDLQYTMNTDSIIAFPVGTLTRGKVLGPDKYLITKKDVKPLKTFWSNMKNVELTSLVHAGEPKEPDELSIAYQRYSDALEGGIIEKRVSSAVMGLEALFLGGSTKEMGELRYRLCMRAGKLLSLIDYNPDEVRKNLTDAYDIRSTYVHGGTLKQRGRQKYERKYGDLNEFSKAILDYLRASIVALLKRPSKTSLIQKIDDSFLDSKKEGEIRKLLFMPQKGGT